MSILAYGGYEFYIATGSYYKVHAFLKIGSDTLNVTTAGNVEYLVVAGGGSGSTGTSANRNSGGGAGGFRTGSLSITTGTKTITVGDGGINNSSGQNSTFDTITSAGGGRGGTQGANGISGGSGGGGGGATLAVRTGGLGNTPATNPPQGQNGGRNITSSPYLGGPGGGAGEAPVYPSKNGGAGLPSNILGFEKYFAGGGGSAGYSSAGPGLGGVGGGGNGGYNGSAGGIGEKNTGGGGGGNNGKGGSGIVVVRYTITQSEYNANYQQLPYIVDHPESKNILAGNNYTTSVYALDYPSETPPSIQWQVSANNGQSWSDIDGATSETYTATVQVADDNKLYRALITGSFGSVYSSPAKLDVYSSPEITIQPVNNEKNSGSQATFTSSATSYPSAPTVQWQISTNSGSTWTNISGATNSTYTTPTLTFDYDSYQYRAVWTNEGTSTISSAAILYIYREPVVLTSPVNTTITEEQTISFSATARGYPVPTAQWQLSTNNGSTWQNVSGGSSTTSTGTTTYTYNPGSLNRDNNGYKYRVVLTNSSGSATSSAATVRVEYLENVLVSNVVVPTSATSATFSVSYNSSSTPNIQWQTSSNGTTWSNISGANSATYIKSGLQSSDHNTFYRAFVTNPNMPSDYLYRNTMNSQTVTLFLFSSAGGIRLGNQEATLKIGNVDATLYRGNLIAFPTSTSQWAYSDSGGTISTFSQNGSNWRVHTFDTAGSHSINFTSDGLVEYLIVGGGGGGSVVYFRSWGYHFMAGGGAGGYRTGFTSVSTGSLSVIVGNGGAVSISGSASSFADIESAGGGQGGSHSSGYSFTGTAGGSGGGSARGGGTGAAGNTPAVIPPQGNKGGNGGLSGGGGGGAGGAGQDYISEAGPGRYGGLGLASDITGTVVTRATGGSAGDRALNLAEPGNGGRGNGQSGFDGQVVIRYKV